MANVALLDSVQSSNLNLEHNSGYNSEHSFGGNHEQLNREQLKDAFNLFNSMSAQLSQSYEFLESKVEELSGELAEVSYQRMQELAEKERIAERLESLLHMLPGGILLLDGGGRIRECNPAAHALLLPSNADNTALLGRLWRDVITTSFSPKPDDGHEISLVDGRRVSLQTASLGSEPGQIILITDQTETRKLQESLSQHQRLSSMGNMVASLAHQIRTPLSAAMLYGANLRNKKLTETARDSFQNKLVSRLQDLEQQVNDMLLFAKSGKQAVVEPVSINKLIEQAKQAIEPQTLQAGATVNLHFCKQDCEILGNATALSGAIQNLIHNSLTVIKSDAVIDISAYCKDEHAYISVRDNGQGISAELADKIFEPFYTSRSQGTGLGLAVVKSVTNAHQGEVRLLSQPGEGAHFCLKIPKLINSQSVAGINKPENQDICVEGVQ